MRGCSAKGRPCTPGCAVGNRVPQQTEIRSLRLHCDFRFYFMGFTVLCKGALWLQWPQQTSRAAVSCFLLMQLVMSSPGLYLCISRESKTFSCQNITFWWGGKKRQHLVLDLSKLLFVTYPLHCSSQFG